MIFKDGVTPVLARDNNQTKFIRNLSNSFPMYPDDIKGELVKFFISLIESKSIKIWKINYFIRPAAI